MTAHRRIYEFGECRVDSGQFLLMKGGHSSPVTPTVFKILIILLERAGEIIKKEELIKRVWPDCFVEEGNLNRNISTLRKALGEKPSDHRYIETLSKTGYRFIAAVKTIEYQPPACPAGRPAGGSAQRIAGRDQERRQLLHAYELAHQGHGNVVGITGDVGLGKTALTGMFLDDLAHRQHAFHLARGRCSESLTGNEPFLPWIEALGTLAREESMANLMKNVAPAWHREIAHAGSGSARHMKRELADFCRDVSPVHPLIILLDDFHWADVPSVDLLSFLAPRLEGVRTLIIICYRLIELRIQNHAFLQVRSDLLSCGTCSEIKLSGLLRAEAESYRPEIYARADGNPLFMRELTAGGGEMTESLRNTIGRNLDRLGDTHRQLLATASVQGREFDSAVIARSMGLNAQDVEEKLRDLDEIHGLIQRIREEQLSDGRFTVRYRFVYGLHQEACFESIVPTRKASINASLAEAFLEYYD